MENHASVQSLERAFRLVEILSQHPGGMPLTELSVAANLHKSTVHRLLSSLSALGYVKKEDTGNKYRLTLRLLELSERITDGIDVLQIAKAPMEQLRNATQEAIHLAVHEDAEIAYVHKVEGNQGSIRMFARIGARRPMYCTAMGKSILATMSDEEVAHIWEHNEIRRYTKHTIVALDMLLRELENVRRLGYALDNEENELGMRCIGAALRDYTGRGKAAISISTPVLRMPDERIPELAKHVLATSEMISAELGYKKKNDRQR